MINLKRLILEMISKPVGSSYKSCAQWKSNGGTSNWTGGQNGRPKISIEVNDSGFRLNYNGKGSGYSISHAKGGTGDSLHQAFNVILCECNPYLMKGNLKPDIHNIKTNCTLKGGIYDMNIWVPFLKMDTGLIYQVNRRGGWGHKGGLSDLPQESEVQNYESPVTIVTRTGGPAGDITEYFITYTIGSISNANPNPIKK